MIRLLRSGVRLLQQQGARGCGAVAFDAEGKARLYHAGAVDALVRERERESADAEMLEGDANAYAAGRKVWAASGAAR